MCSAREQGDLYFVAAMIDFSSTLDSGERPVDAASMAGELPSTYKRLMLIEPGATVEDARVELCETAMPAQLKMDEVLVRVSAAPINPSDYGVWQSSKRADWEPRAIGNEGAGIVVRVGSRITAGLAGVRVGAKVGFTGLKRGYGSYAEYVVAPLATTYVMDDAVAVEDAASFFVNPFTAVGILDTVKSHHSRSRCFVHTAAASQLGKMLVKLVIAEGGIEMINVVRSQKQADTLREIGAKHVVVVANPETDETGRQELAELIASCGADCAFDAVAGGMTGLLVSILPPRATVYVYGRLDGDVKNLAPIDLIYRAKQVKGWYLKTYLIGDGPFTSARRITLASAKVRSGLAANDGWCKTNFVDCDVGDFWLKFIDMKRSSGFTDKKLRIRFDRQSSATS